MDEQIWRAFVLKLHQGLLCRRATTQASCCLTEWDAQAAGRPERVQRQDACAGRRERSQGQCMDMDMDMDMDRANAASCSQRVEISHAQSKFTLEQCGVAAEREPGPVSCDFWAAADKGPINARKRLGETWP